jgi:hypothetical protein
MNYKKNVLNTLVFSVLFLFLLNFIGIEFIFYYLFWWFDIVVHFFGGVAVFFLIFYVFYSFITKKTQFPIFLISIGLLSVTIGWEVFEYIVNILTGLVPNSYLDSFSDICFGVSGGMIAMLLSRFPKREVSRDTISTL